MASIKELAAKCGVSTSTVSRVFSDSDSISDETKELVLKTADEIGFKPREYNKSHANKFSEKTVLLITTTKTLPVSSYLVHSVSEALASHGYDALICDNLENVKHEIEILNKYRDKVSGIIISPCSDVDDYNIKFLQEINKKIPVVTIIRHSTIAEIDSVTSNSFETFKEAVRKLVDEGHTNIALAISKLSHSPNYTKLLAYNQVMVEKNLPIKSDYILYTRFDENESKEKFKDLLTKHPEITAVITSNSGITRGLLFACDELHINIPNDLSVIGFGNDMLFGYSGIGITTIEDHHVEMGKLVAELIVSKMENYKYNKNREPNRIEIPPTIYWRGSEKYPKNRKK